MIYSIKGKVKIKGKDFIVLQTDHIAYQLSVSDFLLDKTKEGETIELLTHLHLREKGVELYGFETPTELTYFKHLVSVPNIGPKSAMDILSLIKIKDLKKAIVQENTGMLTDVSGIGQKTAERIIVELKNKVEADVDISSQDNLVIDALVKMGFNTSEARKAMGKIPNNIQDPQEKVKEALKILSNK